MKRKHIDLLMVFPSGGDLYFTNFKHHLGSAYIIAYLKKQGYNVEQFISDDSYNVKECVKEFMEYTPRIIGFTVYDSNFMQCALLSEGIKAYNSKIIVIFGGPTPSVQSKEILEIIKSVDICVRREGEEVVLELLNNLLNSNFNLYQSDLSKIKGITFRKDNKVIINPDSNLLLSNLSTKNYIDKYPSPYLSKIIPISKAFQIGVITGRGCNQNCIYCNCAVMTKKSIFFHSIERVINELKFINEYKKFIDPVPIIDDTFTILPSRAKKICESIIENEIKIPLLCTTRCDKVNEEILDLMKQAGFVTIGFSLESAVPKVLNTIGKVRPPGNINSEDFEKEVQYIQKLKSMTSYAKKIGINKVYVSIMLGLPGESINDAQKTINLINQLDIDFYTHNIFHIYKGTPIYQNHEKYGYDIQSIGENNKVLTENDFPFDVYKIKYSPKCAAIKHNKIIDYDIIKILSLYTKRTKTKSFFNNAIIDTDIITPLMVKWIQDNLAINGSIIHIYSNKLAYKKYHKENRLTLYNEFSPTSFYELYYREKVTNIPTLKSVKSDLFGDLIGFPIQLKNTHKILEENSKGYDNLPYLIGVDYKLNDTKALYNFLVEISKYEDIFTYLLESKPLPHFQHLCRWTQTQANCKTLETVIIGSDDSIRICWYSNPIGKIGASHQEIEENINKLQKAKMRQRNCRSCKENETCLKCLFPYPLSSEQYCEFKRNFFTIKSAKMVDIFSMINDILFRPINPLEF
ncbi:MAG: B12-binding domain-containing radical SAM protein [Candidatus Odinarchaeota archaeon]